MIVVQFVGVLLYLLSVATFGALLFYVLGNIVMYLARDAPAEGCLLAMGVVTSFGMFWYAKVTHKYLERWMP
jgi:hypothetical protein